MTPSSIQLVCSAMFFTFQWCRSNRSVPENRRRSFRGLRCQLAVDFGHRFTSEFLFSYHCVSLKRSSRPLAASTLSSGPSPSGARIAGRSGTCHVVANGSSAKSIPCVPQTLRMCCHRPVPGLRVPVSTAATDNRFSCHGASVVFAKVFP